MAAVANIFQSLISPADGSTASGLAQPTQQSPGLFAALLDTVQQQFNASGATATGGGTQVGDQSGDETSDLLVTKSAGDETTAAKISLLKNQHSTGQAQLPGLPVGKDAEGTGPAVPALSPADVGSHILSHIKGAVEQGSSIQAGPESAEIAGSAGPDQAKIPAEKIPTITGPVPGASAKGADINPAGPAANSVDQGGQQQPHNVAKRPAQGPASTGAADPRRGTDRAVVQTPGQTPTLARGIERAADTAGTRGRLAASSRVAQHIAGAENSSPDHVRTHPELRIAESASTERPQGQNQYSAVSRVPGEGKASLARVIGGQFGPLQLETPVQPLSRPEIIQIQLAPIDALTGAQPRATAGSGLPTPPPQLPVNAIAVHVAQQAQAGVKRFDIRLDPPELGRLEIRLNVVTRDGQATTHLIVDRAETLDLLQRDARMLERALQNSRLNTSKDGLTFSLKGQDSGNEGQQQDGEQTQGNANGSGKSDSEIFKSDITAPVHRQFIASDHVDIRI